LCQLGIEAHSVIALRMMRLAAGGARGRAEARRMVAEKVGAVAEAQTAAAAAILTGRREKIVAGKVLKMSISPPRKWLNTTKH
jgi:hypothetical protein